MDVRFETWLPSVSHSRYGIAVSQSGAAFEDGAHLYEMNTATTLEDTDIPVVRARPSAAAKPLTEFRSPSSSIAEVRSA